MDSLINGPEVLGECVSNWSWIRWKPDSLKPSPCIQAQGLPGNETLITGTQQLSRIQKAWDSTQRSSQGSEVLKERTPHLQGWLKPIYFGSNFFFLPTNKAWQSFFIKEGENDGLTDRPTDQEMADTVCSLRVKPGTKRGSQDTAAALISCKDDMGQQAEKEDFCWGYYIRPVVIH